MGGEEKVKGVVERRRITGVEGGRSWRMEGWWVEGRSRGKGAGGGGGGLKGNKVEGLKGLGGEARQKKKLS